MTYDLLESVTLASAASSVTFSSIDGSYGDLILVIDVIGSSVEDFLVSFNGDTTGANYPSVRMRGSGSSASSGTDTNRQFAHILTHQSSNILQVMDYAATDKHKSCLARNGSGSSSVWAYALRWANTSAITSIAVATGAGTINSGTLNLYGVAK